MKVEYVCVLTLDERDIRLAAANGGTTVDHPVAPVKTILRVNTEVREQLLGPAEASGRGA
jgi:hypothetical protein